MTGYCKVNKTLHWGYMETLRGEVKAELGMGMGRGQSVAECDGKEKRYSCKQ